MYDSTHSTQKITTWNKLRKEANFILQSWHKKAKKAIFGVKFIFSQFQTY